MVELLRVIAGLKEAASSSAGVAGGATSLHVFFLADHLGHAGGAAHGVTSYLSQTLPALNAMGITTTACFIREEHVAAEQLRSAGIEVTFLGLPPHDPRALGLIRRLVRDAGANVLHATQFESSFIARVLSRTEGLPALIHIHDLTSPPPLVRLMYRVSASPRDNALCISEASRPLATTGYHVPADRVRVLYPGVNLAPWLSPNHDATDDLRSELGIDNTDPVIAMVARFHEVKNHEGMLRMFSRVRIRVPHCVLLLVGDGPRLNSCLHFAEQLNLVEHTRFLGSRTDVPDLLRMADVIAVPSLNEGLSLAAIEGNLAGRPVVGFSVGGLPEVVNNDVCGKLVSRGDEPAFEDALVEALQNRECVSAPRRRAKHAAERFSLANHARELSRLYHSL